MLGLLLAGALSVSPTASGATTASAALSGGNLVLSAPSAVNFAATLTGLNETVTATQQFDVSDATGSGAGWNLQATSTPFCTTGSYCLPDSATAISSAGAVAVACDAGATCTLATNAVGYPYVLPAGASAPTPTKFYNAAANTGMGNQTVSASFSLTIPASAYAGSYSATWTYSLVSAP